MTPQQLRALAKQHRITFQRDWAAFAGTTAKNVLVRDDKPLPDWSGVTTPGKISGAEWVDDVAEVFGADEMARQLAKKRPQLHFWDQRLLRHAYPVARTGGGDPIVQVAGGRRAGQILRTNHESWDGFFEELAKLGESPTEEDFDDEAGPLLRRLGYRGGEPTTDQVVGVLMYLDFDGATLLTKSFADFYRALWRSRRATVAGNTIGKSTGKATGGSRAPRVVPIPTSARVISANRERAYLGGLHGDALVATSPDGTTDRLLDYSKITGIVAAVGAVYVSDLDGLRASSDGGKTFSMVLRGRFDSMARDGRNRLWLSARRGEKNGVWCSRDWKKFATVPAPSNGLVRVLGPGERTALISAFDELFVGDEGRLTSLGAPEKNERIDAAIETSKGTLLSGSATLMRSVDGGKTWHRVKLGARCVTCLFEASNGSIFAATGRQLWVSRDDGKTFRAVEARIDDTVWAAAELGREVLLAAESQLVRVPMA